MHEVHQVAPQMRSINMSQKVIVADGDRHMGSDPRGGTHMGKELEPEPSDSLSCRSFISLTMLCSYCVFCWLISFMKMVDGAYFSSFMVPVAYGRSRCPVLILLNEINGIAGIA